MRLIDADAFRENWLTGGLNEHVYDTNDVLDSIDDAPTIDPVKHGRWIDRGREGLFCSVCNSRCLLNYESDYHPSAYCPHCGAKMQ